MRRLESWKWTAICLSGLAGLFVAISWLALFSMPFADWPHSATRVAQFMVPALFIPFGGSSGWSTDLIFAFVALSNAVLYGTLSFLFFGFIWQGRRT
jgi:hypothetical protein